VGPATGLTFGFDTVFEAWRTAPLPKLAAPLGTGGASASAVRKAQVYARRALGLGDGGAAASLSVFGSFLDGRGGRPFLAFFNVMEPHAPYAPPRGHRRAPSLAALRVVRRVERRPVLRYNTGREEIADGELALLRSQYRGEISHRCVVSRGCSTGSTIRAPQDTVVAVTADHGENSASITCCRT
jgi:hypothetical protein